MSPHQTNTRTKHMNLRTPPRREQTVHFAEFASQGLSSLHATSLVLAWEAVVRDMRNIHIVRRSLSHPSVAPVDLTHTLLDFPILGARHHPSAGRICRLHTLRLLMAHAKPASLPRLLFLPQHSPPMWRSSQYAPVIPSQLQESHLRKFLASVSIRSLLRRWLERFVGSGELFLALLCFLDLFAEAVNRVWHLFNNWNRAPGRIPGASCIFTEAL